MIGLAALGLIADAEGLFCAVGGHTLAALVQVARGRLLRGRRPGRARRRRRPLGGDRGPDRIGLPAGPATLRALGAVELAEQARRELRASGETIARRTPEAWNQLSPTELQIARLAASGLSNREIGERLYVSHRTVGTHLYRLFPKLGITTRAELSAALGAAGRGEPIPPGRSEAAR
jgi:DNA-binding CsgD family transcriptional regulator